jgi:outer membrane receptor for ferrienterochelin and colicins
VKHFLLFLFTITALRGYSQEVLSGNVSSLETGGPAEGVAIYWKETTLGTVSDVNGDFEIPLIKLPAQLVFQYLGYQTDTLTIREPRFVDHKLREIQVEALDEVVVSKTKASIQKTYFKPRNVVSISSDELLKAACCNLSESFETNPAIDVNFSDAITGTKQIKMLGLSSPYLLITQENIPMVRGASQAYGLTFTPGPWVESIQITKGAGSVTNGFESITGQINTELFKPTTSDRRYFNLYRSLDGRNEFNLRLNTVLNENWSASVFAHANQRSRENDRNGDGFLDAPTGEQLNLLGRLQYTNAQSGWVGFLTLRYLEEDRESGEIRVQAPNELRINAPWLSQWITNRFDASLKTGYVFPLRTYQSFGLQLSYSDHSQQSNYGNRVYDIEHDSFYGNLLFNSIFGNTLNVFKTGITGAYDRFEEVVDGSSYSRIDHSIGAFFEYTYNDIDTWSLVLGGRVDSHNRLGAFFTPRVNIRYTPWERSALRFSAGQGRKASNIFAENQSLFFTGRSISIESNNGEFYGLGPERATNYGLSFLQGFSLFNRQGDLTFDFYRTQFIDQVVVDWETIGQLRFYNLEGRSIAENLQIEMNYELSKDLNLRWAYKTYRVETDYISGRLERPLTPKNRFFANLDFKIKSLKNPENQWRFDLTYHHIGSQRLPSNSRDGNNYFAQGYGLWNSQITRAFKTNFEVYMGFENMTNFKQENPIVASDNPFDSNFDASLIYAPVFGRMSYLGLRWNSKN